MPRIVLERNHNMHKVMCGHCKSVILFSDEDVNTVFLKKLMISWKEITCPNCGQHITINDDIINKSIKNIQT